MITEEIAQEFIVANWLPFLILGIVLAEIVFLIILRKVKKPRKDSWEKHVLGCKFAAFIATFVGFWLITGVIIQILCHPIGILITLGCIVGAIIFVWINYHLGKLVAKK